MTAPRIGPGMSAHSIGGPACRNVLASIPGMTSTAVATSTSSGRAAPIRLIASSLAAATRVVAIASAASAASRPLRRRRPLEGVSGDALPLELGVEQADADGGDLGPPAEE